VSPSATAPVEERTRIGAGPAATPTATETAVATDGSPEVGARGLAVETINADGLCDGRQSHPDEYIVFNNVGDRALNLSAWTVGFVLRQFESDRHD